MKIKRDEWKWGPKNDPYLVEVFTVHEGEDRVVLKLGPEVELLLNGKRLLHGHDSFHEEGTKLVDEAMRQFRVLTGIEDPHESYNEANDTNLAHY